MLEFEELVEQNCLTAPETESDVECDLKLLDKQMTGEIRTLENEIPKLQVLVEAVTGIFFSSLSLSLIVTGVVLRVVLFAGVSVQDFDSKTLAVLRGRLVRYLMKSREITIGRNTKDNLVDIDVSLDGKYLLLCECYAISSFISENLSNRSG